MTDAELAEQVCGIVEKTDMPPGDGEDVFGTAMRRVLLWQRGEIARLRADAVRIADLEATTDRLQGKLRRSRDYLKFAANSHGGIVAEIDDVLKTAEAEGGDNDAGQHKGNLSNQ